MASLGDHIESIARRGPLEISTLAAIAAFALLLLSQILDLGSLHHHVEGIDKQVGFLWSPNWSVVYFLLFPFYLYLFCVLVTQCRATIKGLVDAGVITAPGGDTVAVDSVFAAWQQSLD